MTDLRNSPTVKNHIIVCGMHTSIFHFIQPLRVKYLEKYQLQHIVIIKDAPEEKGQDNQADQGIWQSIH